MKKILNHNRGFTLLEIMIAVAIISILVIAAGTSMARYMPDYRFNKYIVTLQGSLQNARLAAVKGNADVFLEFDKNNHRFRAYLDDVTDPFNRGILDAGDTAVATPETPSGVKFLDFFGTGDAEVVSTFNSRGFSDRSGEVHLKNSAGRYKGINLTLAGNSRIIMSSDGGGTWQ